MALIVQKYGGTSVADTERIERVADRVTERRRQGDDVVVVLSAMAGETNRLIALAQEILPHPPARELDVLLATGEQVTVSLFAMAAEKRGFKAVSFLGHQVPIRTDAAHGRARIQEIPTQALRSALEAGAIPVVAGFQGVTAAGDITTLGRGGSDTTAVAVAVALGADLCEIYTDVEGVYTTDPGICPQARKIARISYEEMMEMASLGAKVLEIRSVEFAMRYGMPIHVRSSFNDHPGTLVVREDESMEQVLVSGVTYSRNEARITVTKVPDQPGIAARIFTPISEANIVVDMIIQNTRAGDLTDMTFTVPRTDYDQAMEIVRRVADEIGAESVAGDPGIAKVSIVGVGMRSHSGVASRMFDTLARHGINILMISTSEIKISCVIDEKYTELAVRALHEHFGLDAAPAGAAPGT
ncbi:aspartate kinase [Dissulfurirhabdus thermomarina]|uniref:Aspartokinase n=1 Tax=Dissulfurirhabdus thermomarina TaxID=1765737 RepID=A0A6N9TQ76_DISTH|nr:aspartate kinase [Dissulfurirhabdus thermomarina]NDY41587.1 aspartate kinase [Dissulfurirhabdus thermomarina]NMX22358.1 aspartate kinase [Dissulfurirhabdus thermomarina]